jgi:hypothetical protein
MPAVVRIAARFTWSCVRMTMNATDQTTTVTV